MFYIGLQGERDSLKCALLKKEKGTFSIDSLECIPIKDVKHLYNLPLFQQKKQIPLCSGIKSPETFIRKLLLPLENKRKILKTLPFQLESLIPYTEKAPVICPLFKSLGKQMTEVTIVAISEECLASHLQKLKEVDIVPNAVSCEPMALVRFCHWKFKRSDKILIFTINEKEISCTVCKETEILISQTLASGNQETLALQIERLSLFLKQKGMIDEQTPWFLTGDVQPREEIKKIFKGECLECEDPKIREFAVSIGLALEGLSSDAKSVQFCQGRLTPEHTQFSRQKKILSYIALCLAASLFLGVSGVWALAKKQKALTRDLQAFLPPLLSKKTLSTIEDIVERLYAWESSLKGKRNTFSFLPNVPKVSDVLAWLSTHPAFSSEAENQKEGIEIKSIHYFLSKYPKIGEPLTPYVAEVEVEFFSQTPRAARDFHESLLKGEGIVSKKKEVRWHAQNQLYKAVFELNTGNFQ